MLQTYCTSCRYGDHKNHHKVIEVAPKGMMGGAECRCEGECQRPTSQSENRDTIIKAIEWITQVRRRLSGTDVTGADMHITALIDLVDSISGARWLCRCDQSNTGQACANCGFKPEIGHLIVPPPLLEGEDDGR